MYAYLIGESKKKKRREYLAISKRMKTEERKKNKIIKLVERGSDMCSVYL